MLLSENYKVFLKVLWDDYWQVAALYPTPKKVVRKVLSRISPEAKYFIEYGAGDGAFTREILKNLPKDGKLIAVETNQNFIEQLKKINDQRLILLPLDARKMSQDLNEFGFKKADVIISGVPFSRIKKGERDCLVKNSKQILSENGVFVAYQNIPVIVPVLKKHFKKIDWYFDHRMFPPYFMIFAKNK